MVERGLLAGRRTHRPSRARSTRRSATLAAAKSPRHRWKGRRAMSVTVRPYRRGGWEVDLRVTLPDESEHRLRLKAPLGSKSAAQRWGEERERHWYHKLTHPQLVKEQKEVPTLRQFAPRFVDGHARANRQKPSGIAAKEMILRVHLVPALGHKRLDAIKSEDVQRLKRDLEAKSPKTVNNVLSRAEHAAEEGGGVGGHRADAVHGEAAAGVEGINGVLRLRRVRASRRGGACARSTNSSHHPLGR